MCLSKHETKLYDDLMQPLELDNMEKSLWNDKCDYVDRTKCSNLNPSNYNFVVVQLNIRSIIKNQTSLKQLLSDLEKRNSPVDIIPLCETFLNKSNSFYGKQVKTHEMTDPLHYHRRS